MLVSVTVAELEHIFHIALTRDWEAAERVGEYRVSTLGKTLEEVGFIHGSFRHQVERIGSCVFSAVSEPITLLEADPSRIPAPVLVENIEGGSELFPHIYGALPVAAVVATLPAVVSGGRLVVDWTTAR
jgi:uncharacterized protein (DUF952 family)